MTKTIYDRVEYFTQLFIDLKSTTSRNEKNLIVSKIPNEYLQDWETILNILSGKLKLGYTFYFVKMWEWNVTSFNTITDIYNFLLTPSQEKDLSVTNIEWYMSIVSEFADFLTPLVNRTLKLGIGPSLIEKDKLTPMLAKKYEGKLEPSWNGYYLTEKLDGNRCIAYHNGTEWCYQSRQGRPIKAKFNMSNLHTDLIFDGEILSPEQVKLSNRIHEAVWNSEVVDNNLETIQAIRTDFNKTCGLINSHAEDKDLVYNIFDIIDDELDYTNRRATLELIELKNTNDVRILPTLGYFKLEEELEAEVTKLRDIVTSCGGEGIMINIGSAKYEHKRSKALLKYKDVQSMDLRVDKLYYGTGKFENAIGSLGCIATMDNGDVVNVNVGSGLSDEQRFNWASNESLILDKIVEVEYFALSKNTNTINSNIYSLTFPRLKKVREDKDETSEY